MPPPTPAALALELVADNAGELAEKLKALGENPVKLLADGFAQLTSTLQQLVGSVGQFVEALSPSTMQAFGQEMANLKATIGVAFQPFVQILTSVTREISGVLLPVMQRLAPVVQTLGEIVGNQLVSVVKIFAAGLELVAPLLQVVADYFKELSKFVADAVSLITVFARTIRDAIAAFFGGGVDFKDTFKALFDVVRQVVRSLVTLAATLAVFAGFRDTVASFAAGLDREAKARDARAGGQVAAANSPQISDIASLLRQTQQAAFIAQGGGAAREKSDTEWLRDIAGALRDTANTKKTFQDAISTWWKDEVAGDSGVGGKVLIFLNKLVDIGTVIARKVGGLFGL